VVAQLHKAGRTLRKGGVTGHSAHSYAELDEEMKAIGILLALLAMATAAVVAGQPANPVGGLHASLGATEPTWMLLSGAALLAVASLVRRYLA
jgi:hypothetical protein